ncbi:hypothetical protein ACN469_14010 [Corallococcus terminator]
MSAKNAQHVYTGKEKKLHDEKKSCLDHHSECEGYKTKKTDCCYRWQAHTFAKSNQREIFDTRSDKLVGKRGEKTLTTSAYAPKGKKGKAGTADRIVPQYYAFEIRLPQYKGDWCLEGPRRASQSASLAARHHVKSVVRVSKRNSVADGTNFKKQAYPYWNEAHHLIAKELFAAELASFTPMFAKAIRLALLNAGYNIHGELNMQILPGDAEVGRLLLLPRHLSLQGNGKFNHELYGILVESRLEEVLHDIAGDVDQKKHQFKNPDTSKEKLENISRDCRKRLLGFGAKNGGKSLDEVGYIDWTSP